MNKENEKPKTLTVPMSTEEHQALKIACARLGLTMSEFVRLMVKEKLDKADF